ncbi:MULTISPECIES: flagellar hook protein FlgE [Vibrio]|uniref:Flagellar hook protein FlgE n=1 Tax=Vibrio casei TaxID=673372 RepID=A0A368LJ06_9VIBR|nr:MULTISPECIES: flagellar hook protein FlgE [Vibrio]RCS70732.1 flagellar basal body protein FlaE [Vibrio casei]SJN26580.1 Flagellar hook protein FlgE [Vibrio casei]HBV77567.1 flagellar basal body protein FlaE [Vibrio sp.]
MSLNISLSGLNASSKELNTISNNIANVSTTGFKESRTEFSSVYSGGQSNGVEVVGISQNFEVNGQISGTGRALDMALSGSGFFVVEDGKGQTSYTRNGIFNMDSNGYIVSNSNAKLQGYSVDGDNNLQQGTVGPIKISTQSQAAKATTNAEFVANLDARSEVIDSVVTPFDPKDSATYTNSYTTPTYDSLGNPHTVTQYFVKSSDNQWDVYAVVDGDATLPMTKSNTLNFDESGKLTTGNTYTVSTPVSGADDLNIAMKLDGVTQFGNNFVVSTNNPDGYTSGDYVDMRVESDGSIYANYSNGQTQLQGQVVLANFAAPSELQQTNNTSWVQSFGSGVPIIGTAGTSQFGELTSSALEASNVDLTQSLVSMMTAQRNYQANTKAISTDSQLTQALFQAM